VQRRLRDGLLPSVSVGIGLQKGDLRPCTNVRTIIPFKVVGPTHSTGGGGYTNVVDLNIDAYYAYPHTSLENARWFASFLGDTGLQAPDVLNPLRGHRKSSEWSIVHKQE